MTRSTHSKRLATLAVVAGAMTMVVPVAQGEPILTLSERAPYTTPSLETGYGVDRISDSVDAARAQKSLDLSFQPGYGVDRIAYSVDAARAAQLRELHWNHEDALFAARDLASGSEGASNMQNVVDRPAATYQKEIAAPLVPPGVLELIAAAGPDQYSLSPSIESHGFDWGDFGIGAGAGIGAMLLLGILGAGFVTRRQVRTA